MSDAPLLPAVAHLDRLNALSALKLSLKERKEFTRARRIVAIRAGHAHDAAQLTEELQAVRAQLKALKEQRATELAAYRAACEAERAARIAARTPVEPKPTDLNVEPLSPLDRARRAHGKA